MANPILLGGAAILPIVQKIITSDNIVDTVTEKTGSDILKKYAEISKNTELIRMRGSVTELLAKTLIEPIIIVSDSLESEEIIPKLLELNTDIFTSIYMQAFEVLKNIYGLTGHTIIDLLGTSNTDFNRIAKEDYVNDLLASGRLTMAIESNDSIASSIINEFTTDGDKEVTKYGLKLADKQESSTPGLSTLITREVVVSFGYNPDGKDERILKIPLIIKAYIKYVPITAIIGTITPRTFDKSLYYRWMERKAGSITWWQFLTASDLVSEYKKDKFKDTDGVMDDLAQRSEDSKIKIATHGMEGFQKNYGMLVISKEDGYVLEKVLKGKLKDTVTKQSLLDKSYSSVLNIVDTDYEDVDITIKDIKGESHVSFRTLSKRNEKTNDTAEILKALMSNRSLAL